MDSYTYQKREKEKQKANKKYNPKDFNEYDFAVIIGIIFLSLMLIGLIAMSVIFGERDSNNCESIGGAYEIVDVEYVSGNVVNVYGCVK